MKLLKQNSYEIVKLFINQLGITIFALVLYTGLSFSANRETALTITLWLSIFATLFYLVLLYFAGWEYGAKDKIKVDSGKYTAQPFKGAILAIAANFINFLLAFVSIVFFVIHIAGGSAWFDTVARILNMLMRFISSMYHGMVQSIISSLPSADPTTYLVEAICFAALPLLAVFATQLGYTLGMKNIKISSVFKGNGAKDNSSKD